MFSIGMQQHGVGKGSLRAAVLLCRQHRSTAGAVSWRRWRAALGASNSCCCSWIVPENWWDWLESVQKLTVKITVMYLSVRYQAIKHIVSFEMYLDSS